MKFRKFRKIRRMLRGYSHLKKTNQLDKIMEAQIALIREELKIPNSKISKNLFGASSPNANQAIRDFLITRVGHYSLNKNLLASLGKKNGKVVHPLPPQWRNLLRSMGWNVSEMGSAIFWQGYLFLCLGYGVLLGTQKFLLGILSSFAPKRAKFEALVCFHGLTINEMPRRAEGDSYEVISWYLQWSGREKDISAIGHNIKKFPEKKRGGLKITYYDPVAPLHGIRPNLKFMAWGVWASFFCLFELIRGRWWSSLMLGPAIQAYLARSQSSFAVDYLFSNSGPRKPLWAYEVEAKGGKTSLYFYSTNCDSFMTKAGYQPTPAYYRNMNWSRYLVWDQEQANFIRRCVKNQAQIEIVGPKFTNSWLI
ncbi:MAG: polysaccharide biosynthesis PFTS motif protein [Proteobacteria bacterium]|nr:polysaccharide biosynthesis PFTS motif protein [Pseudomonadota bacterium]